MATLILAGLTLDDASGRSGMLLFTGLEAGVPAFGKMDLGTGTVTRGTPPERLRRVWHMKP